MATIYKYMSEEGLIRTLENGTIKFSHPYNFNDPLEVLGAFHTKGLSDSLSREEVQRKAIQNNNLQRDLNSNYAVTCFSNDPNSVSMWAHYADEHKGYVVGYNLESIPEIQSESTCLVPYQYGTIEYVPVIPTGSFSSVTDQDVEHFMSAQQGYSPQFRELIQRAFLTKHLDWSYEVETRVVMHISQLRSPTPLLLSIPASSIVSVTCGHRSRVMETGSLRSIGVSNIEEYEDVDFRIVMRNPDGLRAEVAPALKTEIFVP